MTKQHDRVKITKAEWDRLGGLRNSQLFRAQKAGRWHYYRAL